MTLRGKDGKLRVAPRPPGGRPVGARRVSPFTRHGHRPAANDNPLAPATRIKGRLGVMVAIALAALAAWIVFEG